MANIEELERHHSRKESNPYQSDTSITFSTAQVLPLMDMEIEYTERKVIPLSSEATFVPNDILDIAPMLKHLLSCGPTSLQSVPAKLWMALPEHELLLGKPDSCVKPCRPDNQQECLGTNELDEPTPLPTDSEVLNSQLRSDLIAWEASDDMDLVNVPRLIQASQRQARDLNAWVTAVKAYHEELVAHVDSAGINSEVYDITKALHAPLDAGVAAALQEQFPFFLSELAELPLGFQQLQQLVCWLAGVPTLRDSSSHFAGVLALFSLFAQSRPESNRRKEYPSFSIDAGKTLCDPSGSLVNS
ncbi:hypothetical protein cyc_02573 [Cyclospora cayetanensis]|uniref:Intraflagellar transport protein 46 homolog n=1 Tax=Cyclospora cayetanensis TaxID=88456 RepID=A0A1D3CYV0_9EIME|nr:hypothetical protein cyc_02573 [Cyclospora cayetanensis]